MEKLNFIEEIQNGLLNPKVPTFRKRVLFNITDFNTMSVDDKFSFIKENVFTDDPKDESGKFNDRVIELIEEVWVEEGIDEKTMRPYIEICVRIKQ